MISREVFNEMTEQEQQDYIKHVEQVREQTATLYGVVGQAKQNQLQAGVQVFERKRDVELAKLALKESEGVLLASGQIDGKNAETRAGQLNAATETEREGIVVAEQALYEAERELRLMDAEVVQAQFAYNIHRIRSGWEPVDF